jgi:hypothetical protein
MTEAFWMGCITSWGGMSNDSWCHIVCVLYTKLECEAIHYAAQVTSVLFLTTYWRNDLIGLYWGMAVGYFVFPVLYSVIAFTSGWEKYVQIAYERTENSNVLE